MRAVLAGLALSAGIASAVHAQETDANARRPRVALALSGGGARGLAHVGALRAFEEAGIPVDAIAANSVGAVVGALYASGHDAAQIEAIVQGMDWEALFSGRPDRTTLPLSARQDRYAPLGGVSFDWKHVRLPAGLLAEHRINRFLIEKLAPAGFAAGEDFDRLPVRFRAVATNLATGEPVVLARGDLARAVRASMSIPLAFPPVEWGPARLVDGYIVDNLPIDVAKAFEPAVVVAVDVGSPGLEPADYESALGVLSQVDDLLLRRRNRDFQAEADVLVRPDLGRHSSTDYSGFAELVRKGYEAARAAVPGIRERLAAAGAKELRPRAAAPGGPSLEGAPIREVVVRGNLRLDDALLKRTFNIPVGPRYDMRNGLRAFDKVAATGLLERAWLSFEPEGDGVRLVLQVREAPPNRAELALGYTEWEKARVAVRLRNQNTFGFGERVELLLGASDAESVATLGLSGDRLVVSGLGYLLRGYALVDKPRFFDADGNSVNRATFERSGVELCLRSDLRRWVGVEAGLRLGQVRTRQEAGIDLPDARDAVRTVFALAAYDTLDSLSWPEDGERLAATGDWSPKGLGATLEYRRLEAEGRLARRLPSRLTVQLDARAGFSDGALPVYDWHRLGGPVFVPGYAHEELKGAQALAGAASLRWKVIGDLRLLVRAGAGNVWARAGDIRLAGVHYGFGVGAMLPTRVGPVSVELGFGDRGHTLVSVAAGWD